MGENNPLKFTIDTVPPEPGEITGVVVDYVNPSLKIAWTQGTGEHYYDLMISSDPTCETELYGVPDLVELETTITDVLANGAYYICLNYRDLAGNIQPAKNNGFPVVVNREPVLSTTSPYNTNDSPIPISVSFATPVIGLELSDFIVTNGNLSNLVAEGNDYTFELTPEADGDVTVDLPGDTVLDIYGYANREASQLKLSYNHTPPTVLVTSTTGANTNVSPILVTLIFSKDVTGLSLDGLRISNGSAANLSGSGSLYTLEITLAAEGDVTLDIDSGIVFDDHNNGSTAATSFVRNYNVTRPSVTLSSIALNNTNISPIPVVVTFSKNVTNFDISDISVGNGNASNFNGSGSVYTVDLTPLSEGDVTVDVGAAVATDIHGNANTAAVQLIRNFNVTRPTVISSSLTAANTNVSPIPLTITFSKGVSGFIVTDINVVNGIASNFSGSGSVYTVDITPDAEGDVLVDINDSVAIDSHGNENTAAPQFMRNYNITSPTVLISSASAFNTNISPIPITVTFSKDVTGFDLGDISVGNGSAGSLNGTGAVYTAEITPSADGLVTVDISAAIAIDSHGNLNEIAPQFSRNFDATPPSIGNVSSMTSNGNYAVDSVISIQVTVSEDVTIVSGTPSLILNTIPTPRIADFVSLTGSGVINFTYTIII